MKKIIFYTLLTTVLCFETQAENYNSSTPIEKIQRDTSRAIIQDILRKNARKDATTDKNKDVLSEDVFFDILEVNDEHFNDFSLSSQKWQKYFLVYASTKNEQTFDNALKTFTENVCERAPNDQKSACTKFFTLLANTYQKPPTRNTAETMITGLRNNQTARESFMQKILDENAPESPAVHDTAQNNTLPNAPEKETSWTSSIGDKFRSFASHVQDKWRSWKS